MWDLSNVAAHLSSFVPNTYGLQNQNLVESLNQGQSILDDYLYNRGIETGQSLDYYSQYQVQLDNDLNNILDSDSANLQTDLITLTLYVHEGSASGPVIPGALITGNDGSSNSFQQTTDNSGYVIIEGDPGTWSFSVSSAGYETSNWDQDINEDDIKDAFLQQEQDQDITLTLYIHDGSASGPIIPDAQVTGWDGSGNSFEKTSSSSGYVTIAGFPGIWSFSVSADGYETNSWDQEITETDTKDAYLQKSTGQPSATGFDLEYPIGVPRILGGTGYVTETSTGWHNAQDWSEYNPDYSGYHPGEDWNYGSGTDDIGEPVYAIAAGTVFDTRDALFNDKSGYGSGIAIEHMLPNSERIYSLYEHIDITAGLRIGDSVSQADRIGSIADTSKLSPHLHFEIRTKQVDTDDWYPNDNGYGYYDSIDSLYADGLTINPSDFIDSHRHVAPEESEPKPEASNPPIVQTFNVTPISVDFGESFAVNYTVSDNSRSGLKQVELWRKDEESDWQQISAKTLAGEIGSISGSLTDSPTAPGKYWYGVHVVDNADNWNDQKNSNTNGQPSSFEPIEVEVKVTLDAELLDFVSSARSTGAKIYTRPPSEEWNKTFGGTRDDGACSVQPTSDGGYIIAGYTNSFSAGGDDVWIIKTDSEGCEIWQKTFGGADDDRACSIQLTGDGGYIIAGNTNSFGAGWGDAWLIKTDSLGNEIWNKTYGDITNDDVQSVLVLDDGGYLIAGTTEMYNSWLIKTDSKGKEIWSKQISMIDDMDFWNGGMTASPVQHTNDGGFIIVGVAWSFGGYDTQLLKIDSEGNEVWKEAFGGAESDRAYFVQQTIDGGYILAGITDSFGFDEMKKEPGVYFYPNVWLIKTDDQGNEIWNKTYCEAIDTDSTSLLPTDDDGYLLAGYIFPGDYDKSNEAGLIKTNSEGSEIWSINFGGMSYDQAGSIKLTSDGGCILVGETMSYGSGGCDVWLIKFSPTNCDTPLDDV